MEDLCFETQQATEKALKAVLLSKGIIFRFTHDLAELLTLLEQDGISIPEDIKGSAALTNYSVEARYPGPFEPVTEDKNSVRSTHFTKIKRYLYNYANS